MFRIILLLQALLLLATAPGDCNSARDLLENKIDSFSNTVEKIDSVVASLKLGDSCVSWEGYWAGFTGRTNTEKGSNYTKKVNSASNYTESVLQGFVANAKGDVYALSRIMKDSKEVLDGITLLKEELEKPENAALKTKTEGITEKVKTVLKSNGQHVVEAFSMVPTCFGTLIAGLKNTSNAIATSSSVVEDVRALGKASVEMTEIYFSFVGEEKLIKPTELELKKPVGGTSDPNTTKPAWFTAAKAYGDLVVEKLKVVVAKDGAALKNHTASGESLGTLGDKYITANGEDSQNGATSSDNVGICGRPGKSVLPQAS